MRKVSTTHYTWLAIFVLCACSLPQNLFTDAAPTPGFALHVTPTLVAFDIVCGSENVDARKAFDDAQSAEQERDSDRAEELYRHAIELDPGFCDAMDNLGVLLRRQDRVDEAVEWYQKSLETKPDNVVALQNLGAAYTVLGQVDDAIETYEKLNEVDPESGEGYYGIGTLYMSQKQYANAIESLKKAEMHYRETGSDFLPDVQLMLGISYFRLDDCENARAYLEPIYSEDSPDMNYILGVCYATTVPKDLDLARTYLTRAENHGIAIPEDVLKAVNDGQ